MSDLIDRQAAIDAIHEDILLKPHINDSFYRENHEFVTVGYVERTLLAVPSAQVRTQMSSADCISRQDAVKVIKKMAWENDNKFGNARNILLDVAKELDSLPSAQPERKKGQWIVDEKRFGNTERHCSSCGAILEGDDWKWRNNNYCYHCGADMRGEQDE